MLPDTAGWRGGYTHVPQWGRSLRSALAQAYRRRASLYYSNIMDVPSGHTQGSRGDCWGTIVEQYNQCSGYVDQVNHSPPSRVQITTYRLLPPFRFIGISKSLFFRFVSPSSIVQILRYIKLLYARFKRKLTNACKSCWSFIGHACMHCN